MSLIIKAVQFAEKAHKGQVRKYSGVPYIIHPIRVMGKVMCLDGCTEAMACAAILHDTIEDCGTKYLEIAEEFNFSVADLVWWLTNPSKGSKENREARKKMDRDWIKKSPDYAKLIKMCDRIDNLKDVPKDEPFRVKYIIESRQLLDECLRGIHPELEREFEECLM